MAKKAVSRKIEHKRSESVATPRGDKTRTAIKTVIAKLAEKRPIAEVTLADICHATKLTTGAVYFHFSGKDEAVEEMAIDLLERGYEVMLERARQSGGTLVEFIRVIIEGTTKLCATRGFLPNALQVTINSRPKAYAAWLAARQPVIDQLADLITIARREKGLGPESSRFLATFMLNSVEDVALDAFHWRNPNLAPFVSDPEQWIAEQEALWTWAILAPPPQMR
jgi:AcrR family transcriptional regulator